MTKAKNKRRHVLRIGISITGGMVLGRITREKIMTEKGQTIKMMTSEGKLVAVEERHVIKSGRAATHAELKEWLKA